MTSTAASVTKHDAAARREAELRDAVAAECIELADVLDGLSPQSWDAPSLCAGWRVHEVVAHLTMPFRYPAGRFMLELLRDRGNFNRMADRCARRDAVIPAAELVAALRDNARSAWHPPGGALAGALVHNVIHGLDITVALGTGRKVPQDRLRVVLDTGTGRRALRHFGTDLTGIELRGDDIDWSFGSGATVSGAAQDLALLLCGRKLPAGQLRGEPARRFEAG